MSYEWSLTLTIAFGLTGIIHILAFGTNKSLYQQAFKTCREARANSAHNCHCCA
jgi:hypothetical protein